MPTESTRELDKNHHMVSAFIEAINNDIENLFTKKATLPKSNLRNFQTEMI